MIENREDTVSVKEEPNYTWSDGGDDNHFELVDSCDIENIETFLIHKSSTNHANHVMASQEKVDEKMIVDFESKNVKHELKSLSTTICKTEYQNYPPNVKIENENQINDINKEILIDFECKHVKPEMKSLKKTICKTENQSYVPVLKIENHILTNYLNDGFDYNSKTSATKLFHECKGCRKTYEEVNVKRNISTTHKSIRPHECAICRKSISCNGSLDIHLNSVHNRSKLFEREICHKSFGKNINLKIHVDVVHNLEKPFEW